MTNEAPFKSEGGGEFGSFAEAASFIEPLAQSFGSFWEHKRTIGTTGLTVQHCFHEAFELTKNSTDKVTRKSIVEKLAEKLGTNHHYDAIRGVLSPLSCNSALFIFFGTDFQPRVSFGTELLLRVSSGTDWSPHVSFGTDSFGATFGGSCGSSFGGSSWAGAGPWSQ